MSAHTKTPWKVSRTQKGTMVSRADGKGYIAQMLVSAAQMPVEANARLIAAAPELLEAARQNLQRWEREAVAGAGYLATLVENGATDAEIAEVVRATAITKRDAYGRFAKANRAAIAKAEGGN